jgi:hypothetical protein
MSDAQVAGELRVEDRLSHLVALGAVVATVLAGLVAYLLVQTSNDANQAGLKADRLGIQAMGTLARVMSDAEADYQAFVLAEALRTQEGLARQEARFGLRHERYALARDRWQRLARESINGLGRNAADLRFHGVHGPEVDTTFPEHFLATQTRPAVRYAALQDAHNEQAARFGGKVSRYIAIVTMFGVALYLFALLSVSIQYDVRRLFAIVGAVLLLCGSVWTAVVWNEDVPPVKKAAARAFADGHVALAAAHKPAAYRTAIDRLGAAVQKRETYARAYFERATARLLLAASEESGVAVLGPDEALETAASPAVLEMVTSDLEKAHKHGLVSAPVLGRLGHYTLLRGWLTGQDMSLMLRGRDYTHQAVEADPVQPQWRFDHALALLATGEHDQGMSEYGHALCLTFYEVAADAEAEPEELLEDPCGEAEEKGVLRGRDAVTLLKAEALSNLELLAMSADRDLLPFVERASGKIVGSTPARHVTGSVLSQEPAPLTVELLPARVTLDLSDYAATGGQPLSVVTTYQHTSRSSVPYVIPELSSFTNVQGGDHVRLAYVQDTRPYRCLPDGSYQVDLYAGGSLVGRGVAPATFGHVHQAAVAPDLDLQTCVPDGWRWDRASLPGLMYGKKSPGGSHGLYLFRFEEHPRRTDASSRQFADFAVELMGAEATRAVGESPVRSGLFEGLQNSVRRTYDFGGSVAEVTSGLDTDDSTVVVVLKGPPGYARGEQADAILQSVSPYDGPIRGQ